MVRINIANFVVLSCLLIAAMPGCHRSSSENHDGGAQAGAAIGVPECDDYLTKYAQCAERAPADRRKALESDVDRTRTAWKSLSANPGARAGLGQSCHIALETARKNTTQYGCTW